MKKVFNHRKRPYEDKINYDEWETYGDEDEYGFSEESAEDDSVEGDSVEYENIEYEASDAEYETAGVFYAETEYVQEAYSEELYSEDVYEASSAEDTYDEASSEEAYDEDYEEEFDEDLEEVFYGAAMSAAKLEKEKKTKQSRKFGFMDGVIVLTGVVALAIALIVGIRYSNVRTIDKQVDSFVTVGSQLANIKLPGQAGLLAVANAEAAKKAEAEALAKEEKEKQEEEERQKAQEERENRSKIQVILELSSIQKDLKIKFLDKSTGKLISNVPFSATVTDPEGKSFTWTDDDKDGIIYKTKLSSGTYNVLGEELTDKSSKDYYVVPLTEKVQVKENIEYKKVDVKNEIRTEAEVNVKKEDTKKNETPVEQTLANTMEWVESTVKPIGYKEVNKELIVNPLLMDYQGNFQRLAQVTTPKYEISDASKSLKVGETFTIKAQVAGVQITKIEWSSTDKSIVEVEPVAGNATEAVVKALKAGNAMVSYTVTGTVSGGDAVSGMGVSCAVTVEALGKGVLTADQTEVTVIKGKTAAGKVTAAGFAEGKELEYKVVSDKSEIATATCDARGNLEIKGVAVGEAQITVSADYKGTTTDTSPKTVIKVKVVELPVLKFEKETATAYINNPLTLKLTLTNVPENAVIKAESSDAGVATVKITGKDITVTAVKEGSTTVTAKYALNGQEIKAICTVMVKLDPKVDYVTKLMDYNKNQIYVEDDGTYREAVNADYYRDVVFYIKSNVSYTGWQTIDGKVYFFDAAGKKAVGTQVIQGAQYYFDADGVLQTGAVRRGIDVSKWNGNIDWAAVKNSGIDYAVVRCGYRGSSQGMLIEDPKFKSNVKGAIDAGLKVGVYFFTQAVSEAEAVEEASMVLELVKNYNISYPIFLDVAASGGRADGIDRATRTAVCNAFCKTIQSAGYTAGVHANKTWLETKLNAGALSAYKIWLAQYISAPTYNSRYDMWQYQANGRVSGISTNVDMNWSYLGY